MPRQQQQQQEQTFPVDMRTSFNILYFVVCFFTMTILPFTRSRMGTRGVGAAGFWAMLFIPLYAGTVHSDAILTFWYAWVIMVIYRRITADKNQHPQFTGWVWMFDWLIKDELNARRLEAVSMLIVGNLLKEWSEPVGQFVIYGSFSLGAKCVFDAMTRARQKEAAHIARIEMLAMQERFQDSPR
jgi:hypothetical protein